MAGKKSHLYREEMGQVFLTTKEIVEFLMQDTEKGSNLIKIKSLTRRVYDISCIFRSLGVVRLEQTTKANFLFWVGSKGFTLQEPLEPNL